MKNFPTRIKVLVATVFLILICILGWSITIFKNHNQTVTNSHVGRSLNVGHKNTISANGRIVSIDLSQMASDGPGIYIIKSANQKTLTVNLIGGESNCDRESIKVPDLKVGDNVETKAVKSKDGSLIVCDTGTYIK